MNKPEKAIREAIEANREAAIEQEKNLIASHFLLPSDFLEYKSGRISNRIPRNSYWTIDGIPFESRITRDRDNGGLTIIMIHCTPRLFKTSKYKWLVALGSTSKAAYGPERLAELIEEARD